MNRMLKAVFEALSRAEIPRDVDVTVRWHAMEDGRHEEIAVCFRYQTWSTALMIDALIDERQPVDYGIWLDRRFEKSLHEISKHIMRTIPLVGNA